MSENEVNDSPIVESNSDITNGSKENVSHLKYPTYSANSNAASKISPGFQHESSPRSSTSSKEQGTVLTSDTAQFIIGQRVWVGGMSPGQIAYIGETHFAPGEWAGVVLDGPNGKNDGCVAGKRYFQCEAKKGIFSRLTRLTLNPLEGAITKGLSKLSPDRSSTVSPTPSTRSMISKATGKHGFALGDRVIVSSGFGSRAGTLRFIGETQFASGNWCGIELDDPTGKNDGSVDGVRYFECISKYGIFVPIAKVSLSPSSKKCRLSRAGSRESLTSVGTMNSIATTNTSRLRMQRRSSGIKPVSVTKSTFSMQDLIREKQNHIEQLMIERDLDREDAQNQALQLQKIITELKSKVISLESKLEEEKRKTEDLQLSIEEATFCGDELNAQTQVYKEKITDLEQRLHAANLADENVLLSSQPVSDEKIVATTSHTLNTQIGDSSLIRQHEKTDAHESLSDFRTLICKIKDFENHETDFKEKLKRYVGDPDEIRRVHLANTALLQTGDAAFLTDLCESLTIAIKELSLVTMEKQNAMTKCKDIENTLKTKGEQINKLELEKNEISRKLEDITLNCKNLSEYNDKQQQEIRSNEEDTKRLEAEKIDISQKLEDVTSNCKSLAEKLQQDLKTFEENAKQFEAEKNEISRKLEDVTLNCESLSELNDKQQQEIKTNEENMKRLEADKLDISQKLEDVTSNCKSLSDLTDKLRQEIKTNEENIKCIEVEKFDISQKLAELTVNYKNLLELNDKQQQEIKSSEENSKRLEVENFDISRKLDDVASNYKSLLELHEKQQQESKTNEEIAKRLEVEKFDISRKLDDIISNCKNLTDLNEKLQQELITNEENIKQLEVEKFEISRKFEDVTSNCTSLSELNGKLQEENKTNEVNLARLEVEKFDISRKLEDITVNCTSLSELNDKLQQELKANEEKTNRLEVEKFDISRKLEDVTSNCEKYLELNEKLQQELKIKDDKMNTLEVKNFEISRQLEDAVSNCESISDLKNKLQQELMSQKTGATLNSKSLSELNENLQLEIKSYEEKYKRAEVEKYDISRKLEDVTSNCKALTELNDKLQQDLKSNEENHKRLEVEQFDITRKLESVTLNCKSLAELNEKLQQELKTNEENNKRIEVEKYDISRKLEDITSNCKGLSEVNDKLKGELKTNEENIKRLEVEKFDISRKLEDVISNCTSLSEQNDKLQQDLKTNEEKTNRLEVEKFDISRKLEDALSDRDSLSGLKEKQQQAFKTNEEATKRLEVDNFEISRKLDDITSNCKSLTEHNEKLQQDIKCKEENIKGLELEKFDISRKLEEITSNCINLSNLNSELEKQLKDNKECIKQLEVEKIDISQKLEDVTLNCTSLSELNGKLQQESKCNEENIKRFEVEKLDISRKLEDITSDSMNLSKLNDELQEQLKGNEESIKQLEEEKNDISGKLEDVTSNWKSLLELNEKLQQEFIFNKETSERLEMEKCEISRKLEEITSNCISLSEFNDKLQQQLKDNGEEKSQIQNGSLSEINGKLQQDLHVNEEMVKRLQMENMDISRKLEDVTSSYDSLSELNIKLQQELISRKLDVVTSNCESFSEQNNELQKEIISSRTDFKSNEEIVSKQKSNKDLLVLIRSVKSELETKYFEEVLENNEILRQFRDKLSNIESELMNDSLPQKEPLKEDLRSKDANDQNVKTAENIIERQKVYQNMHSESISGRFHLDNQLKEVNQLLNTITMQMESLDEDIRSIPPDSKLRADTEEKSCKLQFDFGDLTRRFEALKENCAKFNNENYYSLKELISVRKLEQAKENIKQLLQVNSNSLDKLTISISEQLGFLKEKASNYQLVFKAKEMQLAKQLDNFSLENNEDLCYKSNIEPNSEELVEIECLSNNLQIDLETTKRFIDKIEELKISLKSVSYSHFKLAKMYAQVSAAFKLANKEKCTFSDDLGTDNIFAQFEDANKKLQTECVELTEFLANIMEPYDNSEECFDKLKPTLNKSILQMSYIEGFIERINELTDSNLSLSNVLADKIRLLQKIRVSKETVGLINELSNLSVQLSESKKIDAKECTTEEHSKIINTFQKRNNIENQIIPTDFTNLQTKVVTGVRAPESQSNELQSSEFKADNREDKTAQINFLNSIIADMQQKNDSLKAKITALEALSTDVQKSYLLNIITARKPAPRMFCDICDQFDLHETEDCPLQESDGGEQFLEAKRNNNTARVLPEPRKYCENCEVFGDHVTEDCYGGLE